MASSITLDQWIAFNDELAALARAGIPLERGLPQLGGDLPRKLRSLADEVSRRLAAGESLEQVLSDESMAFPAAYRAVAAAGVRSGKLALALESIAVTARRASELRQLTRLAMAYPLVVVLLGYGLIYFALTYILPTMSEVYTAERYAGAEFLSLLTRVGQSAWWRIPWFPVVLLAGVFLYWKLSGRAARSGQVGGRLPTYGRMLRLGRSATFAEILALLLEHGVPLGESLRLAGEASGDGAIRRAAGELAARRERGETANERIPGLPSYLAWVLSSPATQPRLPEVLRTTAEGQRAKATQIGEWLSLYLPMLLTATIGGGVALALAAIIMGPWYGILYQLGQP